MPIKRMTRGIQIIVASFSGDPSPSPLPYKGRGEGEGVKKENILGLALSGGAARCIGQIGVLEVFEREGIRIDAIAGTSGGALIGALYASGKIELKEMEGLARDIKWRDILMPTFSKKGLISSEKICRFVRGIIGDITFDDLKIDLAVTATDLRRGEKVVLTKGSVARAVEASCSLPLIFTPTDIGGRMLVDGGASSQLPVLAAREDLGARFVIGVDVNCGAIETARLDNLFQIAIHFISLFARRSAMMEQRFADAIIEIDATGISLIDLEKADLILARGRHGAEEKVAQIKKMLAGTVRANKKLQKGSLQNIC